MNRVNAYAEDWMSTKLAGAFDMDLGKMLSPEASAGRHLKPYLANRNVQWNRFELDDLGYMSFSSVERQHFRLAEGDLLVCEGGEIGRTAIWGGELPECYFQKAIHRLRPKAGVIIEPRFVLHYMKYAIDKSLFPGLIGQTSIAHLTREKLALLEVRHPVSVQEQRRIAEILDTLDGQIKSCEQLIRKRKLLFDGLANSTVQSALKDPCACRTMTIGEVLRAAQGGFIQTGPFGSQLHAYEYDSEGIPVVMPQDIVGHSISAEKIARVPQVKALELSRHIMHQGDVVFGRRGDLSRCSAVAQEQDGWLCGTGCLLVRLPIKTMPFS
jgi:type I restriction enzyme, S subunit